MWMPFNLKRDASNPALVLPHGGPTGQTRDSWSPRVAALVSRGYMTLMAIGKTPDIWAAGVEQYGIINWLTMLEHEDPTLQQYEKNLLGDPVKDRTIYDAASPITYLADVKAPLLVLQGDNDPRVPKEEAIQVVERLERDGKTIEAHYYANEGHGFAKRENRIDAIRRTVAWFDKYLKNAP